ASRRQPGNFRRLLIGVAGEFLRKVTLSCKPLLRNGLQLSDPDAAIKWRLRRSAPPNLYDESKERAMNASPFAGKPPEPAMLVNVPKLVTAYYTDVPDPAMPEQRVAFG